MSAIITVTKSYLNDISSKLGANVMKKILILICFLCAVTLLGDTIERKAIKYYQQLEDTEYQLGNNEFRKPYRIISLGKSCSSALHLREFKLSHEAFPFDWLVTPFDSLFNLLVYDFKDFFSKNNLEQRGTKPSSIPIYETKYGTLHLHDFMIGRSIDEQYDQIKEKYKRRIDRLRIVLNSDQFVYFIRTDISQQQAYKLVTQINKTWPALHYMLVAIGDGLEHKNNWNMENVKNFYVSPNCSIFPKYAEWQSIFKKLHLIA